MAPPRHVVAIPFPGRGHINPMMVLSSQLIAHCADITFVITEEWLGLISSSHPLPPPELNIVTIPNCIPSEHGRGKDHAGFVKAVFTKMAEPFEELLDRLELTPRAIIADTYLPWVVEVGNRRGIPVCSLYPMSATFLNVLLHFGRIPPPENRHLPEFNDQTLEQYIPGLHPLKSSDLNTVYTVKPLNKILQSFAWLKKAHCLIFTSFYELESGPIDAIKTQVPCPVYPIGPCIPYLQFSDKTNPDEDYYLTWLDKQPKKSVLYISLGSFLSVSQTQIEELALGLVASRVKFLWVARDNATKVQQIVGKHGLIVPWCEQLKVLCHPSVGGFLTHCGWNSTLEAVYAGIPMLTYPIFWDQDADSRLIVEKWKVGISLKGKMGKDGIVQKEEIAKVVKEFMDLDGDESKELRKESMKLKEAAHNAIEIGGTSYDSLSNFIEGLSA